MSGFGADLKPDQSQQRQRHRIVEQTVHVRSVAEDRREIHARRNGRTRAGRRRRPRPTSPATEPAWAELANQPTAGAGTWPASLESTWTATTGLSLSLRPRNPAGARRTEPPPPKPRKPLESPRAPAPPMMRGGARPSHNQLRTTRRLAQLQCLRRSRPSNRTVRAAASRRTPRAEDAASA